jgi:large subunit ribosomal protein L5
MAKKTKTAEAPKEHVKPPKPRLLERYENEIRPALAKALGRTNPHALPRLEKIVLNMGVGSAITEKKHMEEATAALAQITGQKALVTKSRVAIANFRLREDLPIGAKVTLRGLRMYEFLDRLISLALPRVRDFRGLNPNAFDGHGNYSLGLSEQLVFPELNPDKFLRPQGMNVTLVISGGSDDESRELLRGFGMPFKTEEKAEGGKGGKSPAASAR